MGKGDKKTARGKRFASSFGKFRMRISNLRKVKAKGVAAAAASK
jgi:ribosomal small subunit protein bTHX